MKFNNHYAGLAFIKPESVDEIVLYVKNLFELPDDTTVEFGLSDEFTIKKGNKSIIHGKVSFDVNLKKPVLIVNNLDDIFFKSKILAGEETALKKIVPLYKRYNSFSCRKAYTFKFYSDTHKFSCYLFLYKKHVMVDFNYDDINNSETYVKIFCHKIFSDNMFKDIESAEVLYQNFNQLVELKDIVDYN